MKIMRYVLGLLIVINTFGFLFAQEVAAPDTGSGEFMFVEEIKPGMQGYGISAFKDNQLERFDVEILGVMFNSFPEMDMILARLSGPQFKEMPVISGMSGSPVYINDRLIGAVAYGWPFSMEPIAGITPIKNMMEVFEQTNEKPHPPESVPPEEFLASKSAQEKTPEKNAKEKSSVTIQTNSLPFLMQRKNEYPESITLEPLGAPLIVSGCHSSLMKRIQGIFANTPFMPVMGGGARVLNPKLRDLPIENGSGISIPFVSGSMDIAAVGTVTYRKGNKLVAFGHPFMEMGNVDIPMASAHIFTIIPSYMRPFKLGASVKEVGCIRQDRRPAIGGLFGMDPPMFDMNVSVDLLSRGEKRNFEYRVWETQMFSSSLADIAISESIVQSDKLIGLSAAHMVYTIFLSDGTRIAKEDFFSTDRMLTYQAASQVYYDLESLLNNPFQKPDIANITFNISLIDQFKAVAIETCTTDKEIYKPGETIKIKAYFIPYRFPRFSRMIKIALPEDLRDGSYILRILDGSQRKRLEYQRSPGLGNILSYESLIETLQMNFPLNNLYIVLTERESGLRLEEKEMPHLPPSIYAPTNDAAVSAFSAPIRLNFIREQTMKTDFEIRGSKSLPVKIKRRGNR